MNKEAVEAKVLDQYLDGLLTRDIDVLSPASAEIHLGDNDKQVVSMLKSMADIANDGLAEHDSFDGEGESPTSVPRIGKYLVLDCLGRGGQAVVLLAYDTDLSRQVVLKLYHTFSDQNNRDELLAEGRLLVDLDHPAVVRCYSVDRIGQIPMLVLEYLPGPCLAEFAGTSLDEVASIKMIRSVAAGVSIVHAQGITHGDLTPSNVVLDQDRNPKIIDFGASGSKDDQSPKAGTYAFIAPEKARGETDYSQQRSDVFGIGAILYFLLTGQAPFHSDNKTKIRSLAVTGTIVPPRTLNPRISSAVNQLTMKCLAANPQDRFGSADEFISELDRTQRTPWVIASIVLAASIILLAIAYFKIPGEKQDVAALINEKQATEKIDTESVTVKPKIDITDLPKDIELRTSVIGHEPDEDGIYHLAFNEDLRFRIIANRDCYITMFGWSTELGDWEKIFPFFKYEDNSVAHYVDMDEMIVPALDTTPFGAEPMVQNDVIVVAASRFASLRDLESVGLLKGSDAARDPKNAIDRIRGMERKELKSFSAQVVRINVAEPTVRNQVDANPH